MSGLIRIGFLVLLLLNKTVLASSVRRNLTSCLVLVVPLVGLLMAIRDTQNALYRRTLVRAKPVLDTFIVTTNHLVG